MMMPNEYEVQLRAARYLDDGGQATSYGYGTTLHPTLHP